ncbi:hypothetical protein M404DRAFT_27301 [Pisolithus tinctorius Marx 270]|uniref:CCHC-type domain-containing protein n=1 Tax=Pisolithus tinctorius Marx 270 TaxID=870435 RepID=A0A0C3K1A4_PISTI|nr:hypothetical protein M404DRAFT_27301 [Pisolithus tinctorius Marx 270]
MQLCELTQTIDVCYWERKAEVSCTTKSASEKLQSSNSNSKPKLLSSSSAPKSNAKGKGKQKDPPKSDTPKMKNNLCFFCGKAGHSTKDCPKSTSHTAKACAAMAGTPPPLTAEKAEPKNWSAPPGSLHSLEEALIPTVCNWTSNSMCLLFLVPILYFHL